jgi:CO dehydrogenase/acetyl-CoA synthase delta subunit
VVVLGGVGDGEDDFDVGVEAGEVCAGSRAAVSKRSL